MKKLIKRFRKAWVNVEPNAMLAFDLDFEVENDGGLYYEQ